MTTNADTLREMKIAVLATNGFEQSELEQPVKALRDAGAEVVIVAPESGTIRGWSNGDWGDRVQVDMTIEDALHQSDTFDGLVLPGGVMSPDALRTREDATRFVRTFFKSGLPVAAICHGPQILIDCGVIEGRTVTSYPSIKNDLKNAGARWTDTEVCVDQGLVTSRTPDDLPAFCEKMIEEIAEGVHARQKTA